MWKNWQADAALAAHCSMHVPCTAPAKQVQRQDGASCTIQPSMAGMGSAKCTPAGAACVQRPEAQLCVCSPACSCLQSRATFPRIGYEVNGDSFRPVRWSSRGHEQRSKRAEALNVGLRCASKSGTSKVSASSLSRPNSLTLTLTTSKRPEWDCGDVLPVSIGLCPWRPAVA